MKKIIILSCVLLINTVFLFSYEEGTTYKVCRGYESAKVLYWTGMNLSLSSEGSMSIGYGWSRIDCCKNSTSMNWCDFSMEHTLCKIALTRNAASLCLTGELPEENINDEPPVEDGTNFDEYL